MVHKYSKGELSKVTDAEFPRKGMYCEKCNTYVPQFQGLDEATETRIKALINSDQQMQAMKELQEKVGCNGRWAKIWCMHKGIPTPVIPGSPCPYCMGELRTPLAKQCQRCFKSWHDE